MFSVNDSKSLADELGLNLKELCIERKIKHKPGCAEGTVAENNCLEISLALFEIFGLTELRYVFKSIHFKSKFDEILNYSISFSTVSAVKN